MASLFLISSRTKYGVTFVARNPKRPPGSNKGSPKPQRCICTPGSQSFGCVSLVCGCVGSRSRTANLFGSQSNSYANSLLSSCFASHAGQRCFKLSTRSWMRWRLEETHAETQSEHARALFLSASNPCCKFSAVISVLQAVNEKLRHLHSEHDAKKLQLQKLLQKLEACAKEILVGADIVVGAGTRKIHK